MAKISLGAVPKHFPRTVKFLHIDGTEDALKVSMRYRTREQYAEWIDQRADEIRSRSTQADGVDAAESESFTMARHVESAHADRVSFLLDALDGWELAEPLNADNVRRLCNEFPGCAAAVIDDYRGAIMDGHRGN